MNRRSFFAKALGVAAGMVVGTGAKAAENSHQFREFIWRGSGLPPDIVYEGEYDFSAVGLTVENFRKHVFGRIPKEFRLLEGRFTQGKENPNRVAFKIVMRDTWKPAS